MGPGTTPARLRLLSLLVVAAVLLTWATSTAAVSHRHHALVGFGFQSEALVVTAQRIQTELDQADASAANAFLAGGIEPADQRAAYQQAIGAASTDIADAARQVGTTGAGTAQLHTLAQQLPVYAGLVEQARAGNRQGFPIGAAYLRNASLLLRAQLIPAAGALAQTAASHLNRSEGGATAWSDVLIVALSGIVLLGALVLTQVFITRRTRRAINVGLALATIVSLVLLVVVLRGMAQERADVVTANDHAYTSSARLARARALVYQAQADESEALIAQGNGQSFLVDYAAATGTAATLVGPDLAPDLDAYLSRNQAIAAADAGGRHASAVAQALQTGPGSARAAFVALDQQLQQAIGAEGASFTDGVARAHSRLSHLSLIAALGAVLAILLALAGAQTRINEYR